MASASAAAAAPAALLAPELQRPRLMNKRITANPFEAWLLQLEDIGTQIDLWMAARLDSNRLLGPLMVVAAAACMALALHPGELLCKGLPVWAQDFLDTGRFSLWWLLSVLATAPLLLWVKRCFWTANLEALSDIGAAAGRAFAARSQQQPAWLAPGSLAYRAAAYAAVFARGLLFASAWWLLHSVPLQPLHLAGAALLTAASAAPLILPETAGSTQGGTSKRVLLLLTLALQAAVLAAAVPQLNAALPAAAAMAVCLQQIQQRAVLPRLRRFVVQEGDLVEAHIVSAKVVNGARFDSTLGGAPLTLFAGGEALALQRQREQQLADAMEQLLLEQDRRRQQLFIELFPEQLGEQPPQAAEPASTSGNGSSSSASSSSAKAGDRQPAASTSGKGGGEGPGADEDEGPQIDKEQLFREQDQEFAREQQDLLRQHESSLVGLVPIQALDQRHERWRPFLAELQAALPGAYLGHPATAKLYNPRLGGYWNKDLCWWQPCDQVAEKFGAQPEPGQTFLFPLTDGADARDWVPARVNIVTDEACEIDANYGLSGQQVELTLRVTKLVPGGARQPAAAL